LQERPRALTGAYTAIIRARENRDDPFIAIERQELTPSPMARRAQACVEVLRRYATVRQTAPAFLEAFTFKATPSAKPIIDALDALTAAIPPGGLSSGNVPDVVHSKYCPLPRVAISTARQRPRRHRSFATRGSPNTPPA
jgi:hypothetical protein